MAIYSLRLTSVGKSTQSQPFTAAAHVKYILRKSAVGHVMSARMPEVKRQAVAWMKAQETDDRKNARVIDKITLALPKELTPTQMHQLVRTFAENLTRGRASWLAAFHTRGKDKNNPHCHLVLRDRDVETGRRVMYLSAGMKEAGQRRAQGKSAPTTLSAIRQEWERSANHALKEAGASARIDRRSLKAQGVRRPPQVHEGPNIRAMHQRGVRAQSRDRVVGRHPFRRGGRGGTRTIRYSDIDRGLTRVEYNATIRAASERPLVIGRERERVIRPTVVAPRPVAAMPALGQQQAPQQEQPGWLTRGLASTRSMRRPGSPSAAPALTPSVERASRPSSPPARSAFLSMLDQQAPAPKAQPLPGLDRDRGRGR